MKIWSKVRKNDEKWFLVPNSWVPLGNQVGGSWVAPLTAKLAELGDQNEAKMVKISDPKINHFFDAS